MKRKHFSDLVLQKWKLVSDRPKIFIVQNIFGLCLRLTAGSGFITVLLMVISVSKQRIYCLFIINFNAELLSRGE